MIGKKTLLSATNLNNAFISKTDTSAQAVNSNLTISGGQLTLKNSFLSDNSSSGYLRIDPQGNKLIVYDGVNNQTMEVYSSSGSEALQFQTINGTPSYGLIDVTSSVDHLKMMTNTGKKVVFGGNIETTGSVIANNGTVQSNNPNNALANVTLSWLSDNPRLRIGGSGTGSAGVFKIQGVGDADRMTLDGNGNAVFTGSVTAGLSGFKFVDNAFGGTGDIAKIYLANPSGGENQELTIEVGNESSDTVNIKTPATTGLKHNGNTVWDSANDGSGSGLDADKLDGIESSQFLRSDVDDTVNAVVTISGSSATPLLLQRGGTNNVNMQLKLDTATKYFGIDATGNLKIGDVADLNASGNKIWHEGNDGAGSTLDADKLDGQDGTYYLNWNNLTSKPSTFAPSAHTHSGDTLSFAENTFSTSLGYGGHADPMTRLSQYLGMTVANANNGDIFRFRNVISVEYWNGTSWVAWSTTGWQSALDGTSIGSWDIGLTQKKFRFVMDLGSTYMYPAVIGVNQKYSSGENTYTLEVERSDDNVTYTSWIAPTQQKSLAMALFIPPSNSVMSRYFRFIFDTNADDTNVFSLVNLFGITNRREYTVNGTGLPFSWNYSQNLGLGTTTPAQKLDVVGVVQASGRYITNTVGDVFQALGSTGDKVFRFDNGKLKFYNNTYNNTMLTLDTNGRIGIGSGGTTPTHSLQIAGSDTQTGGIRLNSLTMATLTNKLILPNLNELRFGSTDTWDYNTWAGIKYDTPNLTMYIGGPASSNFQSNSNPALINTIFDGVAGVGINRAPRTGIKFDISSGNVGLDNGYSIYIGNNADSGDRLRLHHSADNAYIDYGSGNLYVRRNTTNFLTLTQGGDMTVAGNQTVTGTFTSNGLISSPGTNTAVYKIGSGTQLWDINVSNIAGLYGVANSAVGGLKLGSTGPTLYGTGNTLGVGTTTPDVTMMLDVNGNIKIGSGNGIYSGYNNAFIVNDHGNGNVTYSGAGGDIYLGYQNTVKTRVSAKIVGSNGTTDIIGTDGTLYYKGINTDSTYLRLDGTGTMTGNLNLGTKQLNGQYGTILRSIDEWLRINDTGDLHTSGVYFGSSVVRTDGELQVGTSGAYFKSNSTDTILNTAMTIANPSITGNNLQGMYFKVGGATGQTSGEIRFRESDNGSYGFAIGYNGNGTSWHAVAPDNGFYITRHENDTTGALALTIDRTTGSTVAYSPTFTIRNVYDLTLGRTRYWNGDVSGGDAIYSNSSLHVGASGTIVNWSETGSFNWRLGLQPAPVKMSLDTTRLTVYGGLMIDNVTDTAGTDLNGFVIRDSNGTKVVIDSNEAWTTDSTNTRGNFTLNTAGLYINGGSGGRLVPRVSYGTAAPSTSNVMNGDIYIQY
jgi:hypothetical protein